MSDSKQVPFLKSRGFLLVFILFLFILILTFFFGDSGIIEILKSQKKIEQLKESISHLEKEKLKLKNEIEALKKNPLALEKKAREKLWLMKQNEKVVVIVRNEDKKENPKAKK